MKSHRCPVCKKVLSREEYEQALGILGEREKHFHEEANALQSRFQHDKEKLNQALQEAKTSAQKARQEGIEAERSRTARLLAGKAEEVRRLKERIEQLKRGATPQTQGLEFEVTLVSRLRREFPEDDIQHKGKHGDVLQLVMSNAKCAGRIIYECKRTPNVPAEHVKQCFQAKQDRNADYGVLVTTGRRRGYNGLAQTDGIIVVAPAAVLQIVSLLRATLIEMARARTRKRVKNPPPATKLSGAWSLNRSSSLGRSALNGVSGDGRQKFTSSTVFMEACSANQSLSVNATYRRIV
ncbi:MAG: DUF2130 domain-containing protein, partial [Acidobacteria bacterium]|nr:DUF2130 domain-containing protein [Acidobacteriota bacterium]